jgi:hypothetical protein
MGLEGMYFLPTVQPDFHRNTLSLDQFEAFRGLGCEIGRISGHFDLSIEAHWVSAKSASLIYNDYAIIYMVTPRVAYRLANRCTPYIGIGSGFQLIRLRPDYDMVVQPLVQLNYQSITFEPFAGYDFRLTKRFGLKLEGRCQVVSPSEATFAQGLRGSAGAYIAFGEK